MDHHRGTVNIDRNMDHHRAASRPPTNVEKSRKSAMKLPTTEHSTKVVRSMQRGIASSRQPSGNARPPERKAKVKTTQPAVVHEASLPTALRRHPLTQSLRREDKTSRLTGENGESSAKILDGSGDGPAKREQPWMILDGTGAVAETRPATQEEMKEKKSVSLDRDHQAANAAIDALDDMFRPTLRMLSDDDMSDEE